MSTSEMVRKIDDGDFDHELDALKRAIAKRESALLKDNFSRYITEGKARFRSNARPSYLAGIEVVVDGAAPFRGTSYKVYVCLPEDAPLQARKRFGTSKVRCPLEILEPVT